MNGKYLSFGEVFHDLVGDFRIFSPSNITIMDCRHAHADCIFNGIRKSILGTFESMAIVQLTIFLSS